MPDPSKESLEWVKASDATMRLRELFASCLNGSRLVSRDFQRDLMALIPQFRRAIEKIEDESDSLRQQNAALVEALHNVMEHVYAQNDYTTRDYEKYYAAVDAARIALAPYRDSKGNLLAPYAPADAPKKERKR